MAKIGKNRGAYHKDDGIAIHMLWKDATPEEIALCQKEADEMNFRNGMAPSPEKTNGYLLFGNSVRDEIVDEVILTGAMNQPLVMKKIAARWRGMKPEEKAKWRAAASKRNKEAKNKISKPVAQPKLRVDSDELLPAKKESKSKPKKNEAVKVKIERGREMEKARDSNQDTEEGETSSEERESSSE